MYYCGKMNDTVCLSVCLSVDARSHLCDSPVGRLGHGGGEGTPAGWVQILPVITPGSEAEKT